MFIEQQFDRSAHSSLEGVFSPELRRASAESREAQTIPLSKSLSLFREGNRVTGIRSIHDPVTYTIEIPRHIREQYYVNLNGATVTIEDSWRCSVHPRLRWSDSEVFPSEGWGQRSVLVTEQGATGRRGWILPRTIRDGRVVVALDWPEHAEMPTFSMWEVRGGSFFPIPVKRPEPGAGSLHLTQILSHIVEGCKMLREAEQQERPQLHAAFPTVSRSHILVSGLSPSLQNRVRGWSYLKDGVPEFTTDFSRPDSLPSIIAFIATNLALCKDVRNGVYRVIGSDFRAEPQLLKLLNPTVVLAGYNFTFLSGRPPEYAARIGTREPELAQLLRDVGSSIDAFREKLRASEGSVQSCDWWDLTEKKLGKGAARIDILIYRTLFRDHTLPAMVDGIPLLQVPHPVAPLQIDRTQARQALVQELGLDARVEKILVVPGLSDDGMFEERLRGLAAVVEADPRLALVSPLSHERMMKLCEDRESGGRVRGLGFRENWGTVLAAVDAAIIRGSWGEILDCVRAGVVPILSSPGLIESSWELERKQFLQEVLGERALNLALLHEALAQAGVPSHYLGRLILPHPRDGDRVRESIAAALAPELHQCVVAALQRIPQRGVAQVVSAYGWLERLGRAPSLDEVKRFEGFLWQNTGE